jgi:hypothetical protein
MTPLISLARAMIACSSFLLGSGEISRSFKPCLEPMILKISAISMAKSIGTETDFGAAGLVSDFSFPVATVALTVSLLF